MPDGTPIGREYGLEENEALKQDCIQLEKEYNRLARQMRYEKDGPEMSM